MGSRPTVRSRRSRAPALGVEIVQRADATTGASSLFMRDVTGSYAGVGWLTGAEDGAALKAQEEALAADPGFIELLDSGQGAYVEDATITQTVLWRRLG